MNIEEEKGLPEQKIYLSELKNSRQYENTSERMKLGDGLGKPLPTEAPRLCSSKKRTAA